MAALLRGLKRFAGRKVAVDFMPLACVTHAIAEQSIGVSVAISRSDTITAYLGMYALQRRPRRCR
jgi:hypothetical protein